MENPIFPIALSKHIIFCAIALVFFLFQFIRQKNRYPLVFAVAIPATLLVYVSENKTWFTAIGIFELAMLILAAVLYALDRRKAKAQASAAQPAPADEAKE
ncbi:MAG: hypothetical protein IJY85_04425 [Ruminococcus sp.]|nr:hypothetical protein [Ruminococcus sp.]